MEMMMIKDVAKNLGVESHVLRYWEEELGLTIKRNSMGHRYYDARDIKLFGEVKELRDRGFSLKDIKDGIKKQRAKLVSEDIKAASENIVPEHAPEETGEIETELKKENFDEEKIEDVDSDNTDQFKVVDFKTAQMQNIMNKIVANALKENKDIITTSIKSEITTDVMKQFDTVMREKEEKEEERYRKLDETIRSLQRSQDEVAATKVKRGFFGRRKNR